MSKASRFIQKFKSAQQSIYKKIYESFTIEELTKTLKASSDSVYRGETELKVDSDYLYLQNPVTKQRISQINLVTGLFNMCDKPT